MRQRLSLVTLQPASRRYHTPPLLRVHTSGHTARKARTIVSDAGRIVRAGRDACDTAAAQRARHLLCLHLVFLVPVSQLQSRARGR